MSRPRARGAYRHDNPLPEIEAARKRAPRAWTLLDEMDRVLWGDVAHVGVTVNEVEQMGTIAAALSKCGRGIFGDISEDQAAEIRAKLAKLLGGGQ